MVYQIEWSRQMQKKVHKIVLDDRRVKMGELADMVGISSSAVRRISTWKFGYENAERKMAFAFAHN